MLVILLTILFNLNSVFCNINNALEGGASIGNYYPRMTLKATLLSDEDKLQIGAGFGLTLREIDTIKYLFGTMQYVVWKKLPWEYSVGLETGVEIAKKDLAITIGLLNSFNYFINDKLAFRLTGGISRGLDTNLIFLSGFRFQL